MTEKSIPFLPEGPLFQIEYDIEAIKVTSPLLYRSATILI